MGLEVDQFEIEPGCDGSQLVDWLRRPRATEYVLLRRRGVEVDSRAVERMVEAFSAPMVATVSPIRCGDGPTGRVAVVPLHRHLPPPATLGAASGAACLISSESLLTISLPSMGHESATAALPLVSELLNARGWRHVAAPGTAIAYANSNTSPDDRVVTEMEGPANVGLEAHRGWVSTQLRGVRLLIDGACLSEDLHNGSQALVLNATRALKAYRVDAEVTVAVPSGQIAAVERSLGGGDIRVVARDASLEGHDVVYRPYQMLDPGELSTVSDVARRLLLGQLDMIGFSNRSYHPSAAMFHGVRNLQRLAMRSADGVAFISDFGLASAVAECPDLDRRRLHVVSCGTDNAPAEVRATPAFDGPFLACLSSTFWHKNREHAIRVFAELCEHHRYEGSLVLAGPEPYYGRSLGAEDELLASTPAHIQQRVLRWGQVDEATKWALLRDADLVIYPSIVEGFGLVPFEAATVGTPCLAYRGSGAAEVLGSARGVVNTWSVEEWARIAAALLSSEVDRAAAVDDARRAAQCHTWAHVAARTWAAIDATIAMPRATHLADEGGPRSRVTRVGGGVALGARAVHFGNRVAGLVERRLSRLRTTRADRSDERARR